MSRRTSPESLLKAIDKFNANHPVGSTAIFQEIPNNPSADKAVTIRSGAFDMGGAAVVMIAGKPGAVPIKRIKPTGK